MLYNFHGQDIDKNDFKSALKSIGIVKDDVVFMHSDVTVFGKLMCRNRNEFFGGIIDSVKESVGNDGTIIMPTFSYSFCNNEIFDVEKTRGTVGALNEFFRKSDDTLRTAQPIFSCSVWGNRKSEFLDISLDSFGENSIFDKLYKNNGKLLFLGADFHACTYLHYIEQSFHIPYRYVKVFNGTIREKSREYSAKCKFYVRYLDKNVILETERLKKYLLDKKIMKCVKLGGGYILTVGAQDLYNEVFKLLEKDIFYLLKEPVQI